MIDTLQVALAQANCAITIAHDGQEVCTYMHARQPQLLVLDRQLPLMNGLEVCSIIRKTLRYQSFLLLVTHHLMSGLKR